MKTQRVETWVGALEDQPGSLAARLKALAAAGANLEFIIARRAPDKPGTGVVFLTPIKGVKQIRAAQAVGLRKSMHLHTVRVEGADKPGLGARLAEALAAQGINLRGLSAAALGRKFIGHIAVDSEADAAKVARIVRGL